MQVAMQFFPLLSFSFFFLLSFFYSNPPDSVTVNLFSNGGTPVEFWNRNSRLKKYRGDVEPIVISFLKNESRMHAPFRKKCFLKNVNIFRELERCVKKVIYKF